MVSDFHQHIYKKINRFVVVVLGMLFLSACSSAPVILQADEKYLQRALSELPAKKPIPETVIIHIESSSQDALVEAINQEPKSVFFQLFYPEQEMLSQAAKAIFERRFINKNSVNTGAITVTAHIRELDYNLITDVGAGGAWVEVTLAIKATKSNDKIHEGEYHKSVMGPFRSAWRILPPARIGLGEESVEQYSVTAYKAVLLAFDKAIDDLIQRLSN